MNAPIKNISLSDKYDLDKGRIYLTGTQALVRLALIQRRRDVAAGLNTAGFISGYRGSPMTAVDNELWRAKDQLEKHHIKFWPGLNENLAMTSVWGTQQVGYFNDAKYDGVFGLWYGKGPGLDQTIDGLRQANEHGTQKHGGVLVCVGDDPYQRSTIDAYYSEILFEDLWMPVLYPSDIQEVLDLGVYGVALSRFSGAYVGYKLLPDTIETASSVDADFSRLKIKYPELELPPGGLNARHPDNFYGFEERVVNQRLPAAIAFARTNKLNKITHDSPNVRIGFVAAGMMWRILLQAFRDLGITEEKLADIGVRILKVSMPFPADLETYAEFANGLEEIVVVDDKRDQTEHAFRKVCYALPEHERPFIVGRHDENGAPLIANYGELSADGLAKIVAQRLRRIHSDDKMERRLRLIEEAENAVRNATPATIGRMPYFCPGCPHNSSTKTPEGSRTFGGVGCHWMATWMDRDVHLVTHMGAEGAQWIGQAPFVMTEHWFQNIGEGTYFHSGSLAVRAAKAAGVNITYKILFNDAVAMTGGQPIDGQLTVPQIARQMRDEGVERISIVSDEPDKEYGEPFPIGVTRHHRRDLDSVQKDLRNIEGVTVLIYDQTCAAEKRRRRKRNLYPDPPKRLFINDRVCEGCGDCSVQSNCLAVEPLKTRYGVKRKINQSACNKDYSCKEGFCPSFVTVHGGSLRKGAGIGAQSNGEWACLPSPRLPEIGANEDFGVLIAGVGGTGVVTIGAMLGAAAHIDGIGVSVVDQLGFAQKGGPVMTHVRFASASEKIHAVRINSGHANTVLGCDMVVTGGDYVLKAVDPTNSKVVLNLHEAITGDFTRDEKRSFPAAHIRKRIRDRVGDGLNEVDATAIATRLLGDAIAANIFMVGYAWQKGLIPLSKEGLMGAIELNGVAVEWNKQAFLWGRRAAHDLALVEKTINEGHETATSRVESLDEAVERNRAELEKYQNVKYAQRYLSLVERARNAERRITPDSERLSTVVAKYAYKLMAYKDEYEVARLYTDPTFMKKLNEQFEGDYRLEFNLAPPLLAKKDPTTGIPRKMQFGPWMMSAYRILASLKRLRGTPFDLFGQTEERKMERRKIVEYEALIDDLLNGITADNYDLAVELASVPDMIRGYGHIKEKNVLAAEKREAELINEWRSPRTINRIPEKVAAVGA